MTQTHRSGLRSLALRMGGAAALASVVLLASSAARADDKLKCLGVNQIDHTQVLNDHQILFYQLGGKIWMSNLPQRCPTLTPIDGFVWESGIDQICGNVEQIRVLRTGVHCQLGAFVPYVKGGANTAAANSGK